MKPENSVTPNITEKKKKKIRWVSFQNNVQPRVLITKIFQLLRVS